MKNAQPIQPDTITRIERALILLAYFIELDGDVHVPMYEQFEVELTKLKATADVRARAMDRAVTNQANGTPAVC